MKAPIIFKKILRKLRSGVVTIYPTAPLRGRILLSYKTEPFIDFDGKKDLHSNVWECREIANIFLSHGYIVDVIDWYNRKFKPIHEYKYFIDLGSNLERINKLINKDSIKIFHATTSHWLFNNTAEYERITNLKDRRGAVVSPRRNLVPAHNIEIADFTTLLGNSVTESTYAYAKKKIYKIPVSITHTYPFPENRDIENAKRSFIWHGGVGAVHKGLDLVLEAFSKLPDYKLYIWGDIDREKDFEKLYWNELYNTPNIKTLGKVDMGGEIFSRVASGSIAVISPTCSEGQSGSVLICMHAGLIPVVSYHAGVDVEDFGLILKENTVEEIVNTVKRIANMSNEELGRRSREAWEYANKNHTREHFSDEYGKFVKMLETTNYGR